MLVAVALIMPVQELRLVEVVAVEMDHKMVLLEEIQELLALILVVVAAEMQQYQLHQEVLVS
jgi:hypothetical protein